MIKKMKRGFTIVELVIVIAIIGVLSAILIPTFSGLIDSVKEAADVQMVKNLNTALVADAAVNGQHETAYDAIKVADDTGYIVEKLTPTSLKNEIVWDRTTDRFILIDTNGEFKYSDNSIKPSNNKYDWWKIYTDGSEIPEADAQVYSIYLADDEYSTESLTVAVGFDAGNNIKLSSITYKRENVEKGQDVAIRTNGELTSLTVNAPSDTVYHYGKAGLIDIISVDSNASYHEHGDVALVKVANGRIVVTEEAEIGGIHAIATNNTFNDIKVAVVGNAEIPTITRDAVSEDIKTEEGTYTKFILEVQTIVTENTVEDSSEYVWIYVVVDGEGEATTTTEVATSKTTLSEETKIAEASQSAVAKVIAKTTEKATTAEAAENALVPQKISSFEELKNVIENLEVVNLVIANDFDITGIINIERKVVIDLDGHTLSNVSSGSRPFNLLAKADVTINATKTGSGMNIPNDVESYGLFLIKGKEGNYNFDEAPSLILNGGIYTGTTVSGAMIKYKTYICNLEMYGVKIVTAGGGIVDCDGDANLAGTFSDEAGVLHKVNYNYATIKDCDFSQGVADNGVSVNVGLSIACIKICNGLIENTKIVSTHGVAIYTQIGEVEIKNCDVTVLKPNTTAEWLGTAISAAADADVLVNGGKYIGSQYGAYVYTSNGRITIKNAEFSGTTALMVGHADTYKVSEGYATPAIIVESGRFEGDLVKANETNLILKGGTFDTNPNDYVAEGYTATESNDVWTITAK